MQRMYNIASVSLLWFVLLSWSSVQSSEKSVSRAEIGPDAPVPELALVSSNFSCNDTVFLNVDLNCQFTLRFDNLLNGTLGNCLNVSDFDIRVNDLDVSNNSVVDGCGYFPYYVGLKNPVDCSDFSSCWGIIAAEDKIAPIITPPADIRFFVSCERIDSFYNYPRSLRLTDTATVKDNCEREERKLLDFNDVVRNQNGCGDIEILRTFFATDEKGNRSTATQTITLTRPTLEDLKLPELVEFNFACGVNPPYEVDEYGNIHPDESGYPFFINHFGDTIQVKKGLCGLAVSYEDKRFDICDEKYKIERRWELRDWCESKPRIFNQLILVGDLMAPEIELPEMLDTVSTNPFGCMGSIEAIYPTIKENCSDTRVFAELFQIIEYFDGAKDTMSVDAIELGSGNNFFKETTRGNHYIVYQITDACKNLTLDTTRVVVVDRTKPVAKCIDAMNVTLDNNGFGRVSAVDINEGSEDNCGLDSLLVMRLFFLDQKCEPLEKIDTTDWLPEVYLNCCDIAEPVNISLRVVDKEGNESQCWMTVNVEDKTGPVCNPPVEVELDCDSIFKDFDYTDLQLLRDTFGFATANDACGVDRVEELPIINELEGCGFGKITRRFIAYDIYGNPSTNLCEQMITVHPVHNYEIKFPKDFEAICVDPDADSILINELGCDLLAVSIIDDKLTTAAEECFKIFREYKVINWCEYDGISPPIVIDRDADCDGIPGDDDVWVLVREDSVFIDSTNSRLDSLPVRDSINWNCFGWEGNPWGYYYGTDSFPDFVSRGYWEYTQIIKVIDTIAPTIFFEDSVYYCMNLPNCAADVAVSFAIVDECVDGNVRIKTYFEGITNEFEEMTEDPWSLVGRYPKYLMAGVIPEGNYRVEITADDQCGNATTVEYYLEIIDCKAPPLICREGLDVELMSLEPGTDADGDGDVDLGMNIVWANDFLVRPIEDECSGPAEYSINRKGETPDREQKSLVVTCQDDEFLEIEIYSWDNANNIYSVQPDGTVGGANYDFCRTFIRVQDNLGDFCNDTINLDIAGIVTTPDGEGLPEVEITLSGNGTSEIMTESDGSYHARGFVPGYDYTVSPAKETEMLKGVSTLDIIYITKHILGVRPLTSPYQMLAADVNQSNSISTLDAILLRKAILRADEKASKLVGWRFIDAKHEFSDPMNPWRSNIPRIVNLNNLAYATGDVDFIGVKIGDVSGMQNLRFNDAGYPLAIELENRLLKRGETIEVPIRMETFQRLEGLQFYLSLDQSLAGSVAIEPVSIGGDFIGNTPFTRNGILLSWDRNSDTGGLFDEDLLHISITAKKTAYLSEIISLENTILQAEAYEDDQVRPLNLVWLPSKEVNEISAKVFPNPFKDHFRLSLNVPTTENVDFEVRSANGSMLERGNWGLSSGNNELELNLNNQWPKGIYFLSITGSDWSKTLRVVKIE